MPAQRYIVRTTLWADDDDNVLQVSVAVLDQDWEPVAHVTRSVGPFDDVERVRLTADVEARRSAWRTTGQLSLL